MQITLLLRHETSKGPVFIGQTPDGRFHVVYDDESLGSYQSPVAAIDDAAGGHTFSPSNGVDLGELGLSDSIEDWTRLPAR